MSEKRSKFQGLFDPAGDEHPDRSLEAATEDNPGQEIKNTRNQEIKKTRNQGIKNIASQEPAGVIRMKTNYEIRQDYHRKLKNIANDEGRKMYQVIEEAIGRYLKSKGRL